MPRYKLFTAEQAAEAGLPHPWDDDWDSTYDYDETLYLYKYRDNDIVSDVEFIATDGGEPEDQTFGRAWGWVADELNNAYEEGRTGQ